MDTELSRKLDFTGPLFDPDYALQTPDHALQTIPCKNAKTFNNLDEYYKKTFVKNVTNLKPQEVVVVEPDRKFTEQQIESCKRKNTWKDPPDVLNRMRKAMGPLSLLNKSLGQKVDVFIRRRKLGPVSSHYEKVCGLLLAFDKHVNVILQDVDRTVIINDQKRERHSNKLFIRGDNIIYVATR